MNFRFNLIKLSFSVILAAIIGFVLSSVSVKCEGAPCLPNSSIEYLEYLFSLISFSYSGVVYAGIFFIVIYAFWSLFEKNEN